MTASDVHFVYVVAFRSLCQRRPCECAGGYRDYNDRCRRRDDVANFVDHLEHEDVARVRCVAKLGEGNLWVTVVVIVVVVVIVIVVVIVTDNIFFFAYFLSL